MSRVFGFIGIIVGTQFIVSTPTIADTTYVGGLIDTNSVWTPAGNPYVVLGDIKIDTLITLQIEPGVEVRFQQDKYMMIVGTLKAIGTETDSIIISASDTTRRWGRLYFKPASAGSLKCCRIEYAGNSAIYDSIASFLYIGYNTISNNSKYFYESKGAGICTYGSPIITNNTIFNNEVDPPYGNAYGAGLYTSGTAIISNNTIFNNSAKGSHNGYGGGIYSLGSPTITSNTISNNHVSSYGDGGGIYSSGSATITNNTISNNSGPSYSDGGGIYASGSPIISNNTITNNSVGGFGDYGDGGGIYSYYGSPTISNNIISSNSAYGKNGNGGAIYSYYGSPTMTGNTITNNSVGYYGEGGSIYSSGSARMNNNIIINRPADKGDGIYNSDSCEISNNTIIISNGSNGIINSGASTIRGNTINSNGRCIIVASGSPQLSYNTIIGEIYFATGAYSATINHCNLYPDSSYFDTTCYIVYNNTANDIDATNNWWGTPSTDSINWGIWDVYDDFNLGKVNYTPFLTSGDTIAPVPPPFNLTADTSKATGVTLSWDSVFVADLAGYKVWYDTDTSGFSYNGTGANEGSSPIDVGNVTTFELTGLTAPTYYLAVTAYDNGGDSSWYSNEVIVQLVGIEEETSKPKMQNAKLEVYPNPLIQSTIIKYHLPTKSEVSLKIYDITGRRIKTLLNGQKEAGNYNIVFNAEDLTPGIYFIRFEAREFKQTKKITLVR